MGKTSRNSAITLAGSLTCLIITSANAETFNIPGGTLAAALDEYSAQSGVPVAIATQSLGNARSKGVSGNMSPDQALTQILSGTGFAIHRVGSSIAIVRASAEHTENLQDAVGDIQLAQAKAPAMALETVTVTSSKLGGGDVQSIPISITALSQEQLTATQTTGGPDLVKQVPNLTFSKTNFTGYNIQIRGIGTQAVSVTTDPAVAVAFNDTPFIRNHFFEQEFYDVSQVEVLRGPQGTLYGRNATAGVVNLVSAKPTDQFEAMASADIGNYHNRRFEGMVNIPIVDDRIDLRVAGEWTKRDGYSFNELTDSAIDGRDLWSGRVSVGWKPTQNLQTYLVWEHFSEDDDRLRSGKQLCKTDYGPGFVATNDSSSPSIGTVNIGGVLKTVGPGATQGDFFTQGCSAASLYSTDSFQAPLGFALPYVLALQFARANQINPYLNETQSHDLRVIESGLNPSYKAKNDVVELNADYAVTPALTVTSQTGYGSDFLFSSEDYNRFGAAPGLFAYSPLNNGQQAPDGNLPNPSGLGVCVTAVGGCLGNSLGASCSPATGDTNNGCAPTGYFCDPQLGCSDRLILEDLSEERSWQLSQEFRIASNFSGPFNFSAGANYLHYETLEKYYVFGNVLTLIDGGFIAGRRQPLQFGYQYPNVNDEFLLVDSYVEPNPISQLQDTGHNYFLSKNPYVLNSYAGFGEVNYDVTNDLKLTGGLRFTDDQKHFLIVPSWLIEEGWGYPVAGTVNQEWDKFTGRAVAKWTPKVNFTDQTIIYASFAHGYKAGGANPPGAVYASLITEQDGSTVHVEPTHPLTFKPEFIDAYELGTKNTLLDGSLTLNGDVFFYNYKGYQISEIVDRTAINENYDATVRGGELESTWEPLPGLKFTFGGGYESTRIDNGQQAVDLMDRTAGVPGWYIVKPFVNESSNCIFPAYVAAQMRGGSGETAGSALSYCADAYIHHDDPLTGLPYVANPTQVRDISFEVPPGYVGYDPTTAPNNGTGFSKDLSGNELPNAPHFTTSLSAEYTMPIAEDWAATLHSDFYWQSQSWWRVFNDKSYDRLRGYSNVNLSLILTNTNGWQAIGYVKNVFDTTAITGAFLNSDDSGLTTNVFLTDPRLFGVRVTKNW